MFSLAGCICINEFSKQQQPPCPGSWTGEGMLEGVLGQISLVLQRSQHTLLWKLVWEDQVSPVWRGLCWVSS